MQLSVLLHNAGQSQRAKWENIHPDVDRSMFDLNVFSVVNLSRLVIPVFNRQATDNIFANLLSH